MDVVDRETCRRSFARQLDAPIEHRLVGRVRSWGPSSHKIQIVSYSIVILSYSIRRMWHHLGRFRPRCTTGVFVSNPVVVGNPMVSQLARAVAYRVVGSRSTVIRPPYSKTVGIAIVLKKKHGWRFSHMTFPFYFTHAACAL